MRGLLLYITFIFTLLSDLNNKVNEIFDIAYLSIITSISYLDYVAI